MVIVIYTFFTWFVFLIINFVSGIPEFLLHPDLFFLNNEEQEFPFSTFLTILPVIVYSNAETDRPQILSDNKNKAGVYKWIHKESGKIYIGSAVDLSKRLSNYYKVSTLKTWDNYISRPRQRAVPEGRALILHGYSSFSLTILEFVDISNLSLKESKNLILSREQFHLDLIFSTDEPNTYNILKVAGSSLGFKHTFESLTKISKALSGRNNPSYGRSGEKHPMFGKYKNIFVYTLDSETGLILNKSFENSLEAAKYFNCTIRTIYYYLDKNKLYKKQWILSTSLISSSSSEGYE
jgi:group I intron endonuclease